MHHHALVSPSRRPFAAVLTALATIFAATQADALTHGQSTQGWAFLEGGVGQTETAEMESERGNFSLWIMTAARTSGAHLADVEVSIMNDRGEPVFERKIDGPWLMIDLPLGRYEVRSRTGQQTQSQVTTIHPGDHHQIVFYFDVEGGVLPKP
jgi:hypothetical protein